MEPEIVVDGGKMVILRTAFSLSFCEVDSFSSHSRSCSKNCLSISISRSLTFHAIVSIMQHIVGIFYTYRDAVLGMDLMDESGEHITGYDHDVFKVRLDKEGNEIEREKQIGKSLAQPEHMILTPSCSRS